MGPLHFLEKLNILDFYVAHKRLNDLQWGLNGYFRALFIVFIKSSFIELVSGNVVWFNFLDGSVIDVSDLM